MTWQECFEKCGYITLINEKDNHRVLNIEEFNDDNGVPDILRQVYLSNKKDELFLILQPAPNTDISLLCAEWDNRIMAFINFGSLPMEGNRKDGHRAIASLKYNITQILLYSNTKGDTKLLMNKPSSFSEEKSVKVSRKIFIGINSDDILPNDNEILLPFWFGELEKAKISIDKEKVLTDLITEDIKCLLEKHERLDHRGKNTSKDKKYFTDEEFETVKEWLINDKN